MYTPPSDEELDLADAQHAERMAARLTSQTRDPQWAAVMERDLGAALLAPDFAGSRVSAVTCAATICKFEADHENAALQMSFSEKLMRSDVGKLAEGGWSQDIEVNGRSRTVVFVARKGHPEALSPDELATD